jgi:hypothetical protein
MGMVVLDFRNMCEENITVKTSLRCGPIGGSLDGDALFTNPVSKSKTTTLNQPLLTNYSEERLLKKNKIIHIFFCQLFSGRDKGQ